MLTVAAARLEQEHASPKLIADLRSAAKEQADARARGQGWSQADRDRVAAQEAHLARLPSNVTAGLRKAMLQRAYDLMWDGNTLGCDALTEWLPAADVDRMFDAWENDQFEDQKSEFFNG